jgi:hypothetical protein
MMRYSAPFVYFGGKRKVAPLVWQRFGNVTNYVDPFFGSGAMLLGRPDWTPEQAGVETVNDADGFVSNFWRAVKAAPDEVAEYADWPSFENDLHARHHWLKAQREELVARLEGDAEYYDAKVAGWWVWGMAQWIGGGFCGDSGDGPWHVIDGKFVREPERDADGTKRCMISLVGDRGVQRSLVHLGDAGQGVARKMVHLGRRQGVGTGECGLHAWMEALAERLARVRVCCGEWSRVMGPTVTEKHGVAAIFLDPPYSVETGRDMDCYHDDTGNVAHDVRDWCLQNGSNPILRIAICGYEGEHEALESAGWDVVAWKAHGGYGGQSATENVNKHRERIWFSPHCVPSTAPAVLDLFGEEEEE